MVLLNVVRRPNQRFLLSIQICGRKAKRLWDWGNTHSEENSFCHNNNMFAVADSRVVLLGAMRFAYRIRESLRFFGDSSALCTTYYELGNN